MGRQDELALMLRRLRARRGGVVLAGPPGVGKTRLAADCLRAAEAEGFVTVRVAGTHAAAALPLGPFAPLLPELGPGLERAETLHRVARAMAEQGDGAPVALFVDDAHLLDPASAVLTQQLTAGGQVFVIVGVRSGVPAPDPVVAIWKDGLAARIDLAPLDAEQVGRLLAEVLGGPASSSTRHLLHERSAGNVLYLRELVIEAVAGGALRKLDGMWQLAAELAPSARLIELVEARLGGLSQASRHALELVALGEPLAAELFAGLVGEATLDDLENRQLVRIRRDGARLDVRLAHPMYGEILRMSLSPWRSRALYRSLAEALEENDTSETARPDDLLRLATWRLRGGGRTRPDTMLAAARRAWSLHDAPLTEELSRSAIDAGADLRAELLLATVLGGTGRAEEAERRLARLVTHDDEERAALACTRMDNLSFGLGRLEDALATARDAELVVADPKYRDEVTTHRASLLSLSGRTAEAVEVLTPLMRRAEGSAFIWCCRVVGYAAAQRGECAGALDIAERGLVAHRTLSTPLPFDQSMHTAVRVLSLTYAGRLAEAEQIARDTYAEGIQAGSVYTQIAMASSLCITFTAQGRIATAIRWGRESAALARAHGHSILLRVALSRLAEALALGRQLTEAVRTIEELRSMSSRFVRIGEADVVRSEGWIKAMAGDRSGAVELLERACVVAFETDNLVAAASTYHDLVRLGRPEHLDALVALAGRMEGPLVDGYRGHGEALVRRDAGELARVSIRYEEIGAVLLAAEASADACAALERQGDGRAAAQAAHRVANLLARCEGGRTPGLVGTPISRSALSGRQLEIATLAASGMSNKEIADKLVLSVRTVENKLHTAYQRLGVSGRSELAEILTRG